MVAAASSAPMAALRMAVVADPDRSYGGVPARPRWDNGRELEVGAVRKAGALIGCAAYPDGRAGRATSGVSRPTRRR